MTTSDLHFEYSPQEGWQASLPESEALFEGRPVHVSVESSEDGLSPDPNTIELLEEILSNLSSIIKVSEKALSDYEADTGDDHRSHITSPHIWIHGFPEDPPTAWTFVVERDDLEDFG
jgi:hypothetical protein